MILYEDARDIVVQAGSSYDCKSMRLPLQDALGMVCAENIDAPITIQPFDNSAMDGFVIKYSDDYADGVVLRKILEVAAGDQASDVELASGECAQIMTGAVIPKGCDTVIPIENITIDGDNITFPPNIKKGAHVRKAGEDFQKGEQVLARGDVVGAQHIMPLSALGIAEVNVFKKPRVVFIATGRELVDDLSSELQSGQIYNSNAHYARAALGLMGAECVDVITITDDQALFEGKIKSLMKQDINIIISSGAVSAGKFDFIKDGLDSLGADILFHKVKMKPGKPNLFAKLPNGSLYFGLPGNPVATTAGLRFFVQPCMRSMVNGGVEKPVKGVAVSSFKKRVGIRMFLKAFAQSSKDGLINVEILDGQASFMVNPFLKMNCWVDVGEDVGGVDIGDVVDLYPLYPHDGLI